VPTFKRRIKNDPREFEPLNRDLAEFLEENGVAARVAYVVHLAAEEMLLNVMKHAYGGARDRWADLTLEIDDGRATLHIEDDGAPFDPRSVPEPDFVQLMQQHRIGGLGIHLVRSMADSLEYERTGGRNHVRIRISPSGTRA
jgi:anti-sigma regulatory factor (Ser/Thr protein kinase)